MPLGFQLTDEQEAFRRKVNEFAAREVATRARQIDSEDRMPRELWQLFAAEGYPAMPIPKEYGGTGRPLLEQCLMMEELTAAGHAPVCIALLEAAALFSQAVLIAGTDEQKQRWLPRVARGEINAAFALTEPGAGSDPAHMTTRAKLDGDHYLITGRKRYVSFASISEMIMVFCKTDPKAGAKGVSAVMVETNRPGFHVEEKIPCIGMRGHQDEEVLLKELRVPVTNRIGAEGAGLKIALATLDRTRTTLCGGFVGLARAALDAATWYAQHRQSFDRPIGDYQALRFPMAEVAAEIEAARFLTWRAAELCDQGKPHTVETAQAKVCATRVMLKSADLAFSVFGGFGGTQRYVVERIYRDAKIWSYAQGSPEVMKEILARRVMKREVPEPVI